jgi:hypothetical protein
VSSPRLRIAGVVPAGAECHAAAPSQAATTISSLLTAYASLAKDFAAGEKATGIRKKNARHHPRPFRPFKATFHQHTLTPPLAGLENQGDLESSARLPSDHHHPCPRSEHEGGVLLTPARGTSDIHYL